VTGRLVDIWYIGDWAACDLACSYCISRVHRHATTAAAHAGWVSAGSRERHRRIVAWISRLPFSLGVRLQTVGEPLLSGDVLAEAGRLSRRPQVRFVELVTNGATLPRRLPVLLEHCRPDKVSLWITHHAGQVEAEELTENAAMARHAGLHVVVNALAFPETLAAVEVLSARCRALDLPFNVDPGLDLRALQRGSSGVPVLDEPFATRLRALPEGREAERRAGLGAAPHGRPCSAGHDYFFVAQDGDVYPCWAASKADPEARLGSALDPDFTPAPRPVRHAACPFTSPCVCGEDLSHLADYGSPASRATSIRRTSASPPAATAPATRGAAAAFALWRRRSRERDGGLRQFERELAGAASLDRAGALLNRLEPLAPSAFGFECPLGDDLPLADFGVTLHRLDEYTTRPPIHHRGLSENPASHAFAVLAAWQRGGGGPAWQAVRRVLLEFDTGSRPSGGLAPSVFLRLESPGRDERRLPDVKALLGDLGCTPLPEDVAVLHRRLAAGAGEDTCVHVGALIGRPGTAVRVVSPEVSPRRALTLLDGAASQPCRDAAGALLSEVSRLDPSLVARVNLDVGATPHERVGIDVTFPGRRRAAQAASDSSWARLIDHLTGQGLCTPAKGAAVLSWRGSHRLVADPWDAADEGVLLSQGISHVKVDVTAGGPSRAKVYLVCSIGR
jgi:hypothetical protein